MWVSIDGAIRKGEIEEMGVFPEAHVGYIIGKGEAIDIFRNTTMASPFFVFEIHEMIPFEKLKEIIRADLKTKIAAMKK